MTTAWPKAPMGEIAPLVRRPVLTRAEELYREIGIRSFGKGVFHKAPVTGLDIADKRVFTVEPGDLLFNIVFAWEGAVAVATEAERGMIGSHRFLTCVTDKSKADARFLNYWFTQAEGRDQLLRASPGGAGRNRTLGVEKLAAIHVPLPPLDEQRRIVARIEELVTKVEEARACRAQATKQREGFILSFIGQRFAELEAIYPARTFGSCDAHVSSGPRNWGKNYAPSGLRFYRAQDISRDFRISNEGIVYVARPPGSQGQSAIVSNGDLLIVITGATVGRVAVYDDRYSPGLVSQHVAVCRIPPASFLPSFALWGLKGPSGQKQLLGSKYGQGKPGLNLDQVRRLSLPCPPIDVQVKIVGELDAFQAKLDEVEARQTETATGLDAMLPAILDKAFKGEL